MFDFFDDPYLVKKEKRKKNFRSVAICYRHGGDSNAWQAIN